MSALAAIPAPSPVLMKALVDAAQILPAPPVAKTVALLSKNIKFPVSISSATTPTQSPSSFLTKSKAIHSIKN